MVVVVPILTQLFAVLPLPPADRLLIRLCWNSRMYFSIFLEATDAPRVQATEAAIIASVKVLGRCGIFSCAFGTCFQRFDVCNASQSLATASSGVAPVLSIRGGTVCSLPRSIAHQNRPISSNQSRPRLPNLSPHASMSSERVGCGHISTKFFLCRGS